MASSIWVHNDGTWCCFTPDLWNGVRLPDRPFSKYQVVLFRLPDMAVPTTNTYEDRDRGKLWRMVVDGRGRWGMVVAGVVVIGRRQWWRIVLHCRATRAAAATGAGGEGSMWGDGWGGRGGTRNKLQAIILWKILIEILCFSCDMTRIAMVMDYGFSKTHFQEIRWNLSLMHFWVSPYRTQDALLKLSCCSPPCSPDAVACISYSGILILLIKQFMAYFYDTYK